MKTQNEKRENTGKTATEKLRNNKEKEKRM